MKPVKLFDQFTDKTLNLADIIESETIENGYDFLGMQAKAANMTREEWIAHYATSDIGSGIDC